jgi:predicted MFS family arabinose efflux permease
MFFASGLLALLPSVAHNVKDSPIVYGLLLGCFGLGAVLGALLLQPAQARLSTERVVFGGIVVLGVATIAAASLHALPALSMAILMGGAAWIVFISLFNVLILNLTPGAPWPDGSVFRTRCCGPVWVRLLQLFCGYFCSSQT